MENIGWVMIPPQIMAIKNLGLSKKVLMGRIIGLIGDKGYCYASNKWLGEQIGISPTRISHMLSELVAKRLIKVESMRNDKKEIIERRIYPAFFAASEPKNNETPIVENDYTPIVENDYTPIVENDYTPIVENDKESIRDISNRSMSKNISLSEVSKTSDDAVNLSNLLLKGILDNNNSMKLKNKTEKEHKEITLKWSKDIDKLIRVDRQEPSTVKEVIRWCVKHGFWGPNILSGYKLREKWDTLVAQKNRVNNSRRDSSMQKNKKEELYEHRLAILQGI